MERGNQLIHDLLRASFGLGREILPYVNLPERFPEPVIRGRNAPFPSGQKLLCTLQHPTLEIEVLVHKRLREPGRGRIHKMPAKIDFPIVDGNFLEYPAHCSEKLRR